MRIQLLLSFLLGFSAFLYAQQSPAPAARQSKESPGEKPDVQTEQADDIVLQHGGGGHPGPRDGDRSGRRRDHQGWQACH